VSHHPRISLRHPPFRTLPLYLRSQVRRPPKPKTKKQLSFYFLSWASNFITAKNRWREPIFLNGRPQSWFPALYSMRYITRYILGINVVCSLQRKEKVDAELLLFFSFSFFFPALQCACTGRASTRVALEMRQQLMDFFYFSFPPAPLIIFFRPGGAAGREDLNLK
jgi:hypothetical protein